MKKLYWRHDNKLINILTKNPVDFTKDEINEIEKICEIDQLECGIYLNNDSDKYINGKSVMRLVDKLDTLICKFEDSWYYVWVNLDFFDDDKYDGFFLCDEFEGLIEFLKQKDSM